jgi:hypothetical protein
MLARARIAALILSLTLIIGAIMSPAWGCINGQTLGEIIWITIDAESFLAGFGDVVTSIGKRPPKPLSCRLTRNIR